MWLPSHEASVLWLRELLLLLLLLWLKATLWMLWHVLLLWLQLLQSEVTVRVLLQSLIAGVMRRQEGLFRGQVVQGGC